MLSHLIKISKPAEFGDDQPAWVRAKGQTGFCMTSDDCIGLPKNCTTFVLLHFYEQAYKPSSKLSLTTQGTTTLKRPKAKAKQKSGFPMSSARADDCGALTKLEQQQNAIWDWWPKWCSVRVWRFFENVSFLRICNIFKEVSRLSDSQARRKKVFPQDKWQLWLQSFQSQYFCSYFGFMTFTRSAWLLRCIN